MFKKPSFIALDSLGRAGAKPPRADLGLGVGTCHNAIYCVKSQLSTLSPTWATWARRGSTFSPIVASPLPTVKTTFSPIVASPLPTVKTSPILRGAWVPPHEDEHLQQ